MTSSSTVIAPVANRPPIDLTVNERPDRTDLSGGEVAMLRLPAVTSVSAATGLTGTRGDVETTARHLFAVCEAQA